MQYTLYVGSYGNRGITRFAFDGSQFHYYDETPATNASYLCLSPDRRHLYAVSETQRYLDAIGGSIASYSVDVHGSLEKTSERASRGLYPCHLLLVGRLLIVCNFASGRVSRFQLEDDGTIGKMLPILQYDTPADHSGSSRLHQAVLTPDGSVAISDGGLDRIYFYRASEIERRQPYAVAAKMPDGYGPRAMVFSGNASRCWYVLCEKQSYLMVYRGLPTSPDRLSRISIGNGRVESVPATLRLSPDGRFMVVTSRGLDMIHLFYLCDNGMPALILEISSRGHWPRDAQFSPDGRFLAVANERSNNIVIFSVDRGHLNYIAQADVESPASLLFGSVSP